MRQTLRPPQAWDSLEAWGQVRNTDLPDMAEAELLSERFRIQRVIARDPEAWIWTGPFEHTTAAEWGAERLGLIEGLLQPKAEAKPKPARARPRARKRETAWIR